MTKVARVTSASCEHSEWYLERSTDLIYKKYDHYSQPSIFNLGGGGHAIAKYAIVCWAGRSSEPITAVVLDHQRQKIRPLTGFTVDS